MITQYNIEDFKTIFKVLEEKISKEKREEQNLESKKKTKRNSSKSLFLKYSINLAWICLTISFGITLILRIFEQDFLLIGWFFLVSIIFLDILLFFLLIREIYISFKQRKTQQTIIKENISKLNIKMLKDQKIVEDLASNYCKKTLALASLELKKFLEERQSRDKYFLTLLPLLTSVLILMALWIYGVPTQKLENNLVSKYFILLYGYGFGGILTLILRVWQEADWQSEYKEYNRRLSILEKAQIIASDNKINE